MSNSDTTQQPAPKAGMTAEVLYDKLKPLQERLGYYFNPEKAFALDVLSQLLVVKDKYGYMACPCRLSSGVAEKDKDIRCPCDYREADVAEYGACFCGLYVDKDTFDNNRKVPVVPDRRPVEKILA